MAIVTKFQDFEIRGYDILDSTQEEARRLIKNDVAKDGMAVRSVIQTSGKGRQGREWISEEGNIFFSLISDTGNYILPQHSAMIAPLVVSKAVAGLDTQIKWPNDVIIEGKKFCGILIEKFGAYIITGIGVNNNSKPEFLDKERKACCLGDYIKIQNEVLLKDIFVSFRMVMAEYRASGFENIRKEYLKRLYKYNEDIELDYLGKKVKGVIKDINNEGELILKTDSGLERFKTGEIFNL